MPIGIAKTVAQELANSGLRILVGLASGGKAGVKVLLVEGKEFYGLPLDAEGPAPLLDVVFLHGLGGHAYETFTATKDDATSFFWPQGLWSALRRVLGARSLIDQEIAQSESPGIRVLTVQYPAPRARGETYDKDLRSLGEWVGEALGRQGVGERPTLYIAHSLGGLVVKSMLVLEAHSQLRTASMGVVFLATPHFGAELASYLEMSAKAIELTLGFAPDMSSKVLKALRLQLDNGELVALNNEFKLRCESNNIRTYSFIEGEALPVVGKAVSAVSAQGSAQAYKTLHGTNHFSIAKPVSEDDLSRILRPLLTEKWPLSDALWWSEQVRAKNRLLGDVLRPDAPVPPSSDQRDSIQTQAVALIGKTPGLAEPVATTATPSANAGSRRVFIAAAIAILIVLLGFGAWMVHAATPITTGPSEDDENAGSPEDGEGPTVAEAPEALGVPSGSIEPAPNPPATVRPAAEDDIGHAPTQPAQRRDSLATRVTRELSDSASHCPGRRYSLQANTVSLHCRCGNEHRAFLLGNIDEQSFAQDIRALSAAQRRAIAAGVCR